MMILDDLLLYVHCLLYVHTVEVNGVDLACVDLPTASGFIVESISCSQMMNLTLEN